MLHSSRHVARAAVLALLLIASNGCEDINWPFHRAHSTSDVPAADASSPDGGSECADLQAQIRDNQQMRRQAPTTSTDQDIVDASEGKADKRIEDAQRRYDELDCPATEANATNRLDRQPPLQPAPGAINR